MMVLVDTSVWIGHLCRTEPTFDAHPSEGLVLIRPFDWGELACGNLRKLSHSRFWIFDRRLRIAAGDLGFT